LLNKLASNEYEAQIKRVLIVIGRATTVKPVEVKNRPNVIQTASEDISSYGETLLKGRAGQY
jgi:hypothetical protein